MKTLEVELDLDLNVEQANWRLELISQGMTEAEADRLVARELLEDANITVQGATYKEW